MSIEIDYEIHELISRKREGTYWDFKQEYHKDNVRLLHDIICLANNIDNRDAYLVFGVADNGEILGVEKDFNRKNQEQFTSFLRGKKFAGGIVPYVILKTFQISNHEIDTLIIKKSDRVPFYLEEHYRHGKNSIFSGSIYTRIEDRNTPINLTADPLHTELLWKRRFGLIPNPFDRLKGLLIQKDKWKKNQRGFYFQEFPEFTVVENEEEKEKLERYVAPFYAFNQTNSSMTYSYYECKYFDTTLFGQQTIVLDSGRYETPVPEFGFIDIDKYHHEHLEYRYFIKDTLLYNLHIFLFDEDFDEARYSHRQFLEIIPIFISDAERDEFEFYIQTKLDEILSTLNAKLSKKLIFEYVEEDKIREKEINDRRIHIGSILVNELDKFRKINKEEDIYLP